MLMHRGTTLLRSVLSSGECGISQHLRGWSAAGAAAVSHSMPHPAPIVGRWTWEAGLDPGTRTPYMLGSSTSRFIGRPAPSTSAKAVASVEPVASSVAEPPARETSHSEASTSASRPPPIVLDGRAVADEWQAEIKQKFAATRAANPSVRQPGLAVVLVGDQPDSLLYVRRKREACCAAGIKFTLCHMPADSTQTEVVAQVEKMAADRAVHGVLVQLPLPPHIAEEPVLEAVGADKDVDGFHPLNAGRLALRGWLPTFVPCTPKGCMELLRRANLPVAGRTAVVLGNSNTVGTPLAMLMRDCGAAAVTVCHKAAADNGAQLAALTRTADVLVAAVGRANLVRGGWIKPGAVVIDVGINVVPTRSASVVGGPMAVVHHGPMLETGPWREEGDYRVVGDVAFEEALTKVAAITPVPGGVGPMTIAALLDNMLIAWTGLEGIALEDARAPPAAAPAAAAAGGGAA